MDLARPVITERMLRCENDSISFSLQAMCKNPLLTIPHTLAANITSVTALEKRLDASMADWKSFSLDENEPWMENFLRTADGSYGLTEEILSTGQPDEATHTDISDDEVSTEKLIAHRKELILAQAGLKSSYLEEVLAIEEDQRRAEGRRWDYTPLIHTWVRMLAENGVLEELWHDVNR
jgi:ubiquitin carboxyl-terminal hydrolase L5